MHTNGCVCAAACCAAHMGAALCTQARLLRSDAVRARPDSTAACCWSPEADTFGAAVVHTVNTAVVHRSHALLRPAPTCMCCCLLRHEGCRHALSVAPQALPFPPTHLFQQLLGQTHALWSCTASSLGALAHAKAGTRPTQAAAAGWRLRGTGWVACWARTVVASTCHACHTCNIRNNTGVSVEQRLVMWCACGRTPSLLLPLHGRTARWLGRPLLNPTLFTLCMLHFQPTGSTPQHQLTP